MAPSYWLLAAPASLLFELQQVQKTQVSTLP